MSIDVNISDLFFNLDLSTASLTDEKGQFTGWDEVALRDEAVFFLSCLHRLNIAVPSADELIADFHKRV